MGQQQSNIPMSQPQPVFQHQPMADANLDRDTVFIDFPIQPSPMNQMNPWNHGQEVHMQQAYQIPLMPGTGVEKSYKALPPLPPGAGNAFQVPDHRHDTAYSQSLEFEDFTTLADTVIEEYPGQHGQWVG